MFKISTKKKEEKEKNHIYEDIKKFLEKNNAGYVLLTCSKPKEDGKMDIEVSSEGDETIVSYLIDSAKKVFQ